MKSFFLDITNRKSAVQLFRYGLVGLSTNFSGYMVYLLITYFGGTPKTTMSILYVVGATLGFLGNRKLTFVHKGSLLGSGIRYVIAHCFGYVLNLVLLIVMVDKLGYPHQWAQAAAIFIVAFYLFIIFKYYVFRETELPSRCS